MNNEFKRPFLGKEEAKSYFPYSREKLTERPIFPTYMFDTGAALCANDILKTLNSDKWLEKIMSGEFFKYWEFEGKFDWHAVWKKFNKKKCTPEWEGHIWLARLYFILPVAQAYLKTKDRKYSQAWFKILDDWIKNNPYTVYPESKGTGEWFDMIWFDMQVAWRTINLVHSIYMLGEGDALDESQWKTVYDLVHMHVNHMYNEVKDFPDERLLGNHKLQIGMALIMVGTLLPELVERDNLEKEKYVIFGKKIVGLNLTRTISEEGVNCENSMSYAHFIARLYVEAELLLRYNGYETIPGCDEKIQKQYEFLYQFATPKGTNLLVGDVFSFDAIADINFVKSVYPLNISNEKKTVFYPDGRVAVLRNNTFEVYVDAMDPDYGMRPFLDKYKTWGGLYGCHQHFGRPQFSVFADGEELICDSGTVNYDRAGLRCRLNSVAGHNVISCEEIPLEHELTITYTTETLETLNFEDGDNYKVLEIKNTVSGEDGKQYVWVRKFELFDDKLEITDTVNASEKLHFRSYLHLPYAIMGYVDYIAENQPISKEGKVVNMRRNEKLQTIKMDSSGELDFRPCMNRENNLDCCEVVERSWYTDSFVEKTVITFD